MRNFIVCTVQLKFTRIRWVGHVPRIEVKSTFKILTVKPTEERPLGRDRQGP